MRGPGGSDLTMLRVIAGAFNGTMRRCGRAIGLALVVPFTAPFGVSSVTHSCSYVVSVALHPIQVRCRQMPSAIGRVFVTCVLLPHLHRIMTSPFCLAAHIGHRGLVSVIPRAGVRACSMLTRQSLVTHGKSFATRNPRSQLSKNDAQCQYLPHRHSTDTLIVHASSHPHESSL